MKIGLPYLDARAPTGRPAALRIRPRVRREELRDALDELERAEASRVGVQSHVDEEALEEAAEAERT